MRTVPWTMVQGCVSRVQVDDLKDKLARSLADMENLRDRTARASEQARNFAIQVGDVAPVRCSWQHTCSILTLHSTNRILLRCMTLVFYRYQRDNQRTQHSQPLCPFPDALTVLAAHAEVCDGPAGGGG